MDHEVMGAFVRQTIKEEIVPSIKLDKDMLTEFAAAVVERFRNPFIKHYLLSILLNSSSKFKTRVLPSILEYQAQFGTLPERLVFSLAALITVYRNGIVDGSAMQARRDAGAFTLQDDDWALAFFAHTWEEYDGTVAAADKVAKAVLANTRLWGQDLNAVPSLTEKTAAYLQQIATDGIKSAAQQIVGR